MKIWPFSRGILKKIHYLITDYSKVAQKYSLFRTMTLLQPQIVQHWRLEVILSTVRLLKEVV